LLADHDYVKGEAVRDYVTARTALGALGVVLVAVLGFMAETVVGRVRDNTDEIQAIQVELATLTARIERLETEAHHDH